MRDYTRFEDNLLEGISPQTLLLLDRGFDHFQFWQQLIQQGIHFITRVKINAAIEYQRVFTDGYSLRDRDCPDRLWNKKDDRCDSSFD